MSYRPGDPVRAAGSSAAGAAMDACESAQKLCLMGHPRSALVWSHVARAALDELDAVLEGLVGEDDGESSEPERPSKSPFEDPARDPLDKVMSHPEDLPGRLVQDVEEQYGVAFYVLKKSAENVKENDLHIGFQRAILRSLARHIEGTLERTDAKMLEEIGKEE